LFVVDGQFQLSELHVFTSFIRGIRIRIMIKDNSKFLRASRLVEKVNCKLLALASQFLFLKVRNIQLKLKNKQFSM
jgi:CII-binding regulator of phage lambda lysogenization HflD